MNLDHLPRQVTLAVGADTALTLPSAAGGGYAWRAVCDAGADVATVSVLLSAAPGPAGGGGAGGEPPALALATETAVVRALRPGTALWNLVLARPFGAPVPLAQFGLRVDVTGGP